jgi:hypothetical protein
VALERQLHLVERVETVESHLRIHVVPFLCRRGGGVVGATTHPAEPV